MEEARTNDATRKWISPPPDPLAWIDASGAAIATIAFGSGRGAAPDLTQLRHLALLPVDTLDLDLSDLSQRRFGDYELLERIGEGGMGVVYRARQIDLDREVAVKLLAAGPWASREFIERFHREAQNAARMQHPNIVTVYDVGSAEELHFFSMQLIRGQSLAAAIRDDGPFEPMRAATLMRTVAEALAYAHSLGVLHLDLKPANILLDEKGVPHVADFGLARRIDSALASDAEEISGTPSYMAPEQAEARAQKITAATDIWGLGAILHEFVTAEPPFRGATANEVLRLVREGNVPPPRRLAPGLPRDLEAIILKCLARTPADRYASARDLADDLARFIERRAVRARPLNGVQRLGRWVRREPRVAIASGIAVAALVAGLAATTREWHRARDNAAHAEGVEEFLIDLFSESGHGQSMSAREILEKGEKQLDGGDVDDPVLRADLVGIIGKMYWDMGDYDHGMKLIKQAVALDDDPRVPDKIRADNLIGLADAENQQSRHVEALQHAGEAAAIAKRIGALDEVSESQRMSASIYVSQGNSQAAEPLLREVLARDTQRLGETTQPVADAWCRLSQALLNLSRFDEAIEAGRKSIAIMKQLGRYQDSAVVAALENIGAAQKQQGRYADAETSMREGYALAEKVYGPDHHLTQLTHSNFLRVLEAEGRYAEALTERKQLLEAAKAIVGQEPQMTAFAHRYLADDALALGHFADAESSARESLAVWKSVEGSNDEADSFPPLAIVANAQKYEGRFADSEASFRALLALQSKADPPDSVWLNENRLAFAELLRWMGRGADVRAEIDRVLASLPPGDGIDRAEALAQSALAAQDAGEGAKGLSDATEAVAMIRKAVPDGNYRLATPLIALARAKSSAGDAAGALPLIDEALRVLTPIRADDDPRMVEAKAVKVGILAALHQDEAARALRSAIA
ncbi:MAG TPA: serine/threonine-protein kinase, partial [Rhodanobacteraceae bacterium]|nr:serine/threonine-protein kinase [Rhodanobacteraceae bacterium]